jgi:dCMP deaminase
MTEYYTEPEYPEDPPSITENPCRLVKDEAYMQMAEIWAKRSKANKFQVGTLIIKDEQIISDGYNGMPAGSSSDVCEEWIEIPQGFQQVASPFPWIQKTKPEVFHAEANALMKICRRGGLGAKGGTLYVTLAPCIDCAKMIIQAQVTRVVYRTPHKRTAGINLLKKYNIIVDHLKGET